VHAVLVDARIVFKKAIDALASNIVLAHNHPSGSLRPSKDDVNITKKLKEGAKLLDMNVVDHIIVTGGGYYSFADDGNL